ncbi:uncharacterized protein TRIADDRAFT_24343 [Trichoplax adhaerens]|uniref:Adenosine 3'-phospho 5'-phosphosulfate transporter 2 n=1 Tax=Trichoplax adhaerens TaxID=10228 RepID=B3RTY8_TRIAD|nr:hypothetical protein TRIADDRAFT_24343 [Trichoplax adhaerens]EDV26218.1 hypothetical protein TRIADDRAFT_24343 [Trichoplax adhaerens]|eukprot:XP_002112251.1 hypothetical protein TRIADDRAFT_24343 [Trichoplax adhaerens]
MENTNGNSKKALAITVNKSDKVNLPVSISLFGFSIDSWSTSSQFMAMSSGVLACYLIYGYIQERMFLIKGFKQYGWYLTLVQFGYYTIFGAIEMQLKNPIARKRRIPLRIYAIIAFLTVATIGLSNTSLGYLNYPTQVIFKSCKLIPVMIGGILIQGKKYTLADLVAALLMCVGLILFTLADSKVSPTFDSFGVILISLALCADAAIGNVQEKAMKGYNGTNLEMVFYSFSIGFVYIFMALFITNQLGPAFRFCSHKALTIYGFAAILSFTGYIGVNMVLTLVRVFGALMAVTVTTFRKAITVVLSFLFFEKPFTIQYVWSGLIVLLGIALNIYKKNKSVIDDWINAKLRKTKLFKQKSVAEQVLLKV